MLKENALAFLRKNCGILFASFLVAASLAHHLFSVWDRKANWLLLIFLITYLLVTWLFLMAYPRFRKAFPREKIRQFLFVVSALILAALVSWKLYRTPVSYQTITLTPQVSEGQQVQLLEIKAGGKFIQLEVLALEHGWYLENGILTAGQSAQPISDSFLLAANEKVSILLHASPQGGHLAVSLGNARKEADLFSEVSQEKLLTLYSQYRGIPNGLFISFLLLADFFTFFLLFMMLLILQERGQRYFAADSQERFLSHRAGLLILAGLTSLLHLFSALSVPLIVDSDSPTFLEGAVHLLEHGNFDGVSMVRGPGSTFLFAPVLWLFGRNPWGMKIFLHLFALACVLIVYRLGWQLSKKRWVAFAAGFLVMLLPDLYYYANFVMSDLPNFFLVALFSSLMLDALEDFRFWRILVALLVASFATLLRSENLLMLMISAAWLGLQPGWNILKGIFRKLDPHAFRQSLRSMGMLLLAVIPAVIPVLWWSANNLRLHGFFGLSNYAGEVLYVGWIYYAEVSGFDIRNEEGQAVQEIDFWISQYPVEASDDSGIATGWEVYPSLIKAGYSSNEAFQLLQRAALESITSHLDLIPDILLQKWKDAFKPQLLHMLTFPLAGESLQSSNRYADFFDPVELRIEPLIRLQRIYHDLYYRGIADIYRALMLFCVAAMFFSLYQKPLMKWGLLVLIAMTRIFVSNLMGLSMWRYTLAGLILLAVFGVISVAVLFYGVRDVFVRKQK